MLLAPEPPQPFLDRLHARSVPVSVGRSIVATGEPHQQAVLEAIRELGLELQIIFNKGAVMSSVATVDLPPPDIPRASMNRASIFAATRANTRKAIWARTAASTSAGQMAA
jgi:hypothetical protein